MNLLTFNIEGYNRNNFYLAQLLKEYECIFIFLQEHWLPHHEAENKLSTDFKLYNFHTTSSDMFLPTEDLLLRSGPTWHGTAIGWHNSVNSKIRQIPIVSDRFCGVCYDDNGTKIVAYTAYLPTSGKDDDFIEIVAQLTFDIQTNIEDRNTCSILIGLDSNQSESSTARRTIAMTSFITEFSFKTILLDNQPTFHHNNQIAESQIDHILYFIPESSKDIHVQFAEHLCIKDNSANVGHV